MLNFIYRELHPAKSDNLEQLKSHILESSKEIPTLKVWELQGEILNLCNNLCTSCRI